MSKSAHTITPEPRSPDNTGLPKVALAHDWLCGYRGGEAVLDHIARLLTAAGRKPRLYTMFDNGKSISKTVDRLPRTVAGLGRLPGASGPFRRWMLPLYPKLVGDLSKRLRADQRADPIEALVSTSSAAIKGLRPPPGIPHLCYCHAPARYVWSIGGEYAVGARLRDRARSAGLALFRKRFQEWDRASAGSVTRFIANSSHTQQAIRECYDRPATVIHPPVRTEFFKPKPHRERRGFWLVVSALEPYKRVDLAVEAAKVAGVQLIVVGTGSMRSQLQKMAGPGVQFRGRVDEPTLRHLYRTAALLVFPQIEDFGISAVEAMACGCPVLARAEGGALDFVRHGENGALFEGADANEIAKVAKSVPLDAQEYCRATAELFSVERFERAMLAQLRALR